MWGVTGIYFAYPDPFIAAVDYFEPPDLFPSGRRGDAFLAWIVRMHFGRYGGMGVRITYVVIGLLPAVMFVTGSIMWWNRVLRRWWLAEPKTTRAAAAFSGQARQNKRGRRSFWRPLEPKRMKCPLKMTSAPIQTRSLMRALRRISLRVMPYVFLLYIVAFLDRVNVGYAASADGRRPRFQRARCSASAPASSSSATCILEIPGSVIVERWSARKWIARIMISWGILAVDDGVRPNGAAVLHACGFCSARPKPDSFPGLIVYLSHWFRYQDRAKAVAWFMAAIPVSNLLGSPISGLLLGVNWLRRARLAMAVHRRRRSRRSSSASSRSVYLTDWPREATWLPEDEKQWIIRELESEKQAAQSRASRSRCGRRCGIGRAAAGRRVFLCDRRLLRVEHLAADHPQGGLRTGAISR